MGERERARAREGEGGREREREIQNDGDEVRVCPQRSNQAVVLTMWRWNTPRPLSAVEMTCAPCRLLPHLQGAIYIHVLGCNNGGGGGCRRKFFNNKAVRLEVDILVRLYLLTTFQCCSV